MERSRKSGRRGQYRQIRGRLRVDTIVYWWVQKHGEMSRQELEAFVRSPEVAILAAMAPMNVRNAVEASKDLTEILRRARATISGHPQTMKKAAEPRPSPRESSSRSTWTGGDVSDDETEARRATERKLARPSVDEPDPYL